ncbi:TPA: SAP domain-containing protein [Pasteurella multocida]|uniref:SAP domain-containing protein n=1 Tax=Pasteurella multocida TaxID=747 RepID=UPI0032F13668|nr:SAP domain-containing protein [Pasteurella multocida]HDR0675390.1 SAP domain-containing protein [Pasteurella multocida]HDR0677821.1 SAP domain-containing protein [Pasteurella multocida]HDR0679947.1 SAP domain-containing protein [Pasteurella multocida]HDR0681884.1 SAP domain-containing protein [Pasteurella multocida]
MSYPFISLNSKAEELKAHLRDVCGIEKNGTKKELVDAILEYEKTNGLERNDGKDKSGDAEVPSDDVDLPLNKQKKVKIKIAESNGDRSDVYVSINDWDALIQRNKEVVVPESVFKLLSSAGDYTYSQNDDGSLEEGFVPRYNIIDLGYVE